MACSSPHNYELSEERLDELFVKEVNSVTKLIYKLPTRDVIMATCTHWFNIFERSPAKEKFARNCMLLLLHKQLNDKGTLTFPFTDLRSCQRDLRTLHRITMQGITDNNIDSIDSSACETSDSVEWCSLGSISSNDVDCDASLYVRLEDANKQLVEHNAELATELQALQQQYVRLQEERQNSRKICETLREENIKYGKEIAYLKDIFACSAISALKLLSAAQALTVKPQFFVTLYSVLCDDEQGVAQIEALDKQFEKLVRQCCENYIKRRREPILRDASRQYDELRIKVSKHFKEKMLLQKVAQEKEITLTAMRYLTVLRKQFIHSYKGPEREKRSVLKFLHQLYKEVSEAL